MTSMHASRLCDCTCANCMQLDVRSGCQNAAKSSAFQQDVGISSIKRAASRVFHSSSEQKTRKEKCTP